MPQRQSAVTKASEARASNMAESVIRLCYICKDELGQQLRLVEADGSKEYSGKCDFCKRKKYIKNYKIKKRSKNG